MAGGVISAGAVVGEAVAELAVDGAVGTLRPPSADDVVAAVWANNETLLASAAIKSTTIAATEVVSRHMAASLNLRIA